MRFLVALAALILATTAHADMAAREGENMAIITTKPCTDQAVLARIEQGTRGFYRAAVVRFGGKTFGACWAPMGTSVHLVYPDGDQGLLPMAMFQELPSA